MSQVSAGGNSWAIVLAAGSGTRLSGLTSDSTGSAVPKQFCSLDGESTLIERALARARGVVDTQRVTAVVAPEHRRYWQQLLHDLAPENVVVQPCNRGTAVGILLPLLCISSRDPQARVLILPSDHHVDDEGVLAQAMHDALESIRQHPSGVALLGIEADEPDPELGYIVPQSMKHPRLSGILRFAEKPAVDEATKLIGTGALWNSFILACRASSMLDLVRRSHPWLLQSLQAALEARDEAVLKRLYQELPSIDFSRHVATGQEAHLSVLAVPRCGWNDLGTPDRLAKTIARLPRRRRHNASESDADTGWINLSTRLAQIHPALLPDA